MEIPLKRTLDILLVFLSTALLIIPLIFIGLAVLCTSKGGVIHWSSRVGVNNNIFKMPKFRTMLTDTPSVATHLLTNPDQYLTPIGSFLRKNSLDELPQLLSILKGDMTFVGPRPALYNQEDLVEIRTKFGVHKLKPGLTGWAQINGRDELSIQEKVILDKYYLDNMSFVLDIKIIFATFFKVIHNDGVSH
jgi:O-antigen biosynthesis protein WbqP